MTGNLSLPQLRDIAADGVAAVKRLADHGTVGMGEAYNIARGALTYITAVASGDVASQEDYDGRRRTCRLCPHYTILPDDADKGDTPGFCGTPGKCRMGEREPTCGCLIDAKAAVRSATCPQKRWHTDTEQRA